MAGVKGKSGRHKSDVEREGYFFRLRPDVIARVERCTPLLEMQEGVRMSKAEALEHLLTLACETVERIPAPAQTSLAMISKISQISLSELSALPDYGTDVPGYGFLEDIEDTPAPASHTNGQGAPAPETPEPPVAVLKTSQTPVPAPTAKRAAPHALPHGKLAEIADEYTRCQGLSYSEFARRLHDKGIWSSTAKNGSRVPANRGNVKKWLDQAREEGLL